MPIIRNPWRKSVFTKPCISLNGLPFLLWNSDHSKSARCSQTHTDNVILSRFLGHDILGPETSRIFQLLSFPYWVVWLEIVTRSLSLFPAVVWDYAVYEKVQLPEGKLLHFHFKSATKRTDFLLLASPQRHLFSYKYLHFFLKSLECANHGKGIRQIKRVHNCIIKC